MRIIYPYIAPVDTGPNYHPIIAIPRILDIGKYGYSADDGSLRPQSKETICTGEYPPAPACIPPPMEDQYESLIKSRHGLEQKMLTQQSLREGAKVQCRNVEKMTHFPFLIVKRVMKKRAGHRGRDFNSQLLFVYTELVIFHTCNMKETDTNTF